MIALFSFAPKYCPYCGKEHERDTLGDQNLFEGCSCTCSECGLHYQYVDAVKLLDCAGQNGDMANYVTPSEAE